MLCSYPNVTLGLFAARRVGLDLALQVDNFRCRGIKKASVGHEVKVVFVEKLFLSGDYTVSNHDSFQIDLRTPLTLLTLG